MANELILSLYIEDIAFILFIPGRKKMYSIKIWEAWYISLWLSCMVVPSLKTKKSDDDNFLAPLRMRRQS